VTRRLLARLGAHRLNWNPFPLVFFATKPPFAGRRFRQYLTAMERTYHSPPCFSRAYSAHRPVQSVAPLSFGPGRAISFFFPYRPLSCRVPLMSLVILLPPHASACACPPSPRPPRVPPSPTFDPQMPMGFSSDASRRFFWSNRASVFAKDSKARQGP